MLSKCNGLCLVISKCAAFDHIVTLCFKLTESIDFFVRLYSTFIFVKIKPGEMIQFHLMQASRNGKTYQNVHSGNLNKTVI